MATFNAIREQPAGVLFGFVIASLLFAGAFTLALKTGSARADTEGVNVTHACVSLYTGQSRLILPGSQVSCSSGEVLVALGSADLAERVEALETQVPDCMSDVDGNARFSGCNVEIVNGLESTNTVNGTGNLIIGYNENSQNYERSGSHNVIIGEDHGYTNAGGLVAGFQNIISGAYASVTSGANNDAQGLASSVSGGTLNVTFARLSSISGGATNAASGIDASVSGGRSNDATGELSSISGGASGTASATESTVSGGRGNTAASEYATVSGGEFNTASGQASSVTGGGSNTASGGRSSVTGGNQNAAEALWSTVSGGQNRTASNPEDWVGGGLTENS